MAMGSDGTRSIAKPSARNKRAGRSAAVARSPAGPHWAWRRRRMTIKPSCRPCTRRIGAKYPERTPPGPPPCAKPQLPLGLSAGICAGGLSMDSVLDARARLNRCMLRRYARVSLHANRTPATLRNRGRRRRTSRALEAHYLPRAFSRRAATARRGGLGCGQTLERAGAHFRMGPVPVERSPASPALRAAT